MVVRCVPTGFDREGIVCLQVGRVFGLYPNTKDLRPRSFRQALELTARSRLWVLNRRSRLSGRSGVIPDECDRLVERRPARPSVTHRDVLVNDRHATEEDVPVPGVTEPARRSCETCDHAICGQLCSPSARRSSMTVCRYMPTSAHRVGPGRGRHSRTGRRARRTSPSSRERPLTRLPVRFRRGQLGAGEEKLNFGVKRKQLRVKVLGEGIGLRGDDLEGGLHEEHWITFEEAEDFKQAL
jgi:hypothetical protein